MKTVNNAVASWAIIQAFRISIWIKSVKIKISVYTFDYLPLPIIFLSNRVNLLDICY